MTIGRIFKNAVRKFVEGKVSDRCDYGAFCVVTKKNNNTYLKYAEGDNCDNVYEYVLEQLTVLGYKAKIETFRNYNLHKDSKVITKRIVIEGIVA